MLACALLALFVVGIWALPLDTWVQASAQWINRYPILGRVLFVLLFVALTVLMVPGSVLVLCGGFLFGTSVGAPLSWIGVTLGAAIVACLSRTIARDWLAGRFSGDPRFRAIDDAVAGRGFAIVLLTRLSLLMPFNVLNIIYGLSRIPLSTMTLATWIGMIPAVVLYSYLGATAKNIDQLFSGELDDGGTGEVILGIGLTFIAIVTYVIHRTATGALKRRLEASAAAATAPGEVTIRDGNGVSEQS